MARLLIHAAEGDAKAGDDLEGVLPLLLRGLRAWALLARRRASPASADLRVADLEGRQFFRTDALLPVVDVPLPEGTYHVTVNHQGQVRRYTIALARDTTFDLHLRRQLH